MSISSIGSSTSTYYQQLASGKKINSAADDASGLAIANKMESQANGYDIGAQNAATSKDMINVADGALQSISDSLQRIRELSVQASNGTYGNTERSSIQSEINQLKDQISSVASNTQFNKINLLDGTMTESKVASNPDGSGMTINMPNSTLDVLGIANYDVTGKFNISDIDKAIDLVSGSRGRLGAQSNSLEYTINSNNYASQNVTAARSRIEDLDYGKAVSDLKKEQVLDEYRTFAQKQREEQERVKLRLFEF